MGTISMPDMALWMGKFHFQLYPEMTWPSADRDFERIPREARLHFRPGHALAVQRRASKKRIL
jgi:hypothetical protein